MRGLEAKQTLFEKKKKKGGKKKRGRKKNLTNANFSVLYRD